MEQQGNYEVIHYPAEHRFEVKEEGLTAYVEYELTDDGLDILHTVVPRPLEGRGIASALVRFAYDFARANGLKPQATCSYAIAWLQKHPEYVEEDAG